MERLTNSDKEIPTLSDNAEYWLKAYFKLKDYEDLEELIGVSLKDLTKIFNDHIPEDCKNPKKAMVLTDDDVDKWNEYKKAEEQGLLLRLPCKVGDTVWVVTSPFNVFEGIEYNENLCDECYESFISSVTFYKNSVQYRISAKVTNHFIGAYYNEQNFGKTVFLTQAEAEQKLKEMEG